MKKLLTRTATTILTMMPASVLAQPQLIQPSNSPTGNLQTLITRISNTILLIVGIIAVLMLIIGGFQYIASAGNPESVGKAKSTILYAVIGILVTLLAYALVQYVISRMFTS